MKWLNDYRMRLVLIGFAAVVALGGGNAKADFIFGEPTNMGPVVNGSLSNDWGPCISADGLSLFFSSTRTGGYGSYDLYVATRPTIYDEWGTLMNLGTTVNSSTDDIEPAISADGLELYFTSRRTGNYVHDSYIHEDIWVTKRATKADPWGPPENLGPLINSSYVESDPSLSSDGLELYFASNNPGHGSSYLYVARRANVTDNWGDPVKVDSVNWPDWLWCPDISADGRLLIFGSSQAEELWLTTRDNVSDDWPPPVRLGPTINSGYGELSANISSDGQFLLFNSSRPGGEGLNDLWQAQFIPIVDFNGDGFVDAADMCIMVDHWGTDEPLCDIGPMPWGDGIVDVQDLIVLAEHLFEDDRLIAHWKLDETEGSIAYDSSGNHHANLNGNPVWQPTNGYVNGALQFDGTEDYVSTPFVLNPGTGQFSVFAWIKGGAPGQVIISQTGGSMFFGATWLGTDPSYGKFMTSLTDPQPPLQSDVVITDGQWHHIGLVWDRLFRHLYVDGAEVAEDATQLVEVPSDGGLHIGAAKDLDVSSFFSGLIDDVRIYDVALSAEEIEALAH